MTDADFGVMAYRQGHAAQIRAYLLASARAGEAQGSAEAALVAHMCVHSSKTERAWMLRYDAARADGNRRNLFDGKGDE